MPSMRQFLTFQTLVAVGVLGFGATLRAEPDQPASNQDFGSLFRFMNTLPELIDQNLPFLERGGTYWFYVHPHLGNPFQGKYFRLDTGGWLKVTDSLDLNLGAQSYFWRDPDDKNATRLGFYGANLGVKYSRALSSPKGAAISLGIDHSSPLGRPPISLVDGVRHTVPYVTYSRPLIPSLRLVGYATFGLDLVARTNLPESFRVNELHSDSITCSVGASREWSRLAGSITLSGATTELMGHGGRQVFNLNPQVFVPVFRKRLPRWHATAVLGTHFTTGPDGRQVGANVSINVNFKSRP